LECQTGHLDSTSFHTDGIYETKNGRELDTSKSTTENGSANQEENQEENDADSSRIIHITKGYSRDHRPDLN